MVAKRFFFLKIRRRNLTDKSLVIVWNFHQWAILVRNLFSFNNFFFCLEQVSGTNTRHSHNMQNKSKLEMLRIFHRFSMNYRAKFLFIRLAINSFVPFVT